MLVTLQYRGAQLCLVTQRMHAMRDHHHRKGTRRQTYKSLELALIGEAGVSNRPLGVGYRESVADAAANQALPIGESSYSYNEGTHLQTLLYGSV